MLLFRRAFIIVLIAWYAPIFGAAERLNGSDQVRVTRVNANESTLGPVQFQGFWGSCFAHAAADLISFELGTPVSAEQIFLNNALMGKPISPDVKQTLSKGGFTDEAIARTLEYGYCPSSDPASKKLSMWAQSGGDLRKTERWYKDLYHASFLPKVPPSTFSARVQHDVLRLFLYEDFDLSRFGVDCRMIGGDVSSGHSEAFVSCAAYNDNYIEKVHPSHKRVDLVHLVHLPGEFDSWYEAGLLPFPRGEAASLIGRTFKGSYTVLSSENDSLTIRYDPFEYDERTYSMRDIGRAAHFANSCANKQTLRKTRDQVHSQRFTNGQKILNALDSLIDRGRIAGLDYVEYRANGHAITVTGRICGEESIRQALALLGNDRTVIRRAMIREFEYEKGGSGDCIYTVRNSAEPHEVFMTEEFVRIAAKTLYWID